VTLLDITKLVRHHLGICLAVVITGVLLGGTGGLAKGYLGNAEYTAQSILTVSEPTATISADELMPLVQAIANNVIAETKQEDISVIAEYDLKLRSITFVATAGSDEAIIEVANNAAQQTAEEARLLLQDVASHYRSWGSEDLAQSENGAISEIGGTDKASALESVSFTINDASQVATNSGGSVLIKYILVGFFIGCFVAICLVIAIDLVKAPIKDQEDAEACLGIPVLAEEGDDDFGLRLWVNMQFALGRSPRSICLAPVGVADEVEEIRSALNEAISRMRVQFNSEETCNSESRYDVVLHPGMPVAEDIGTAVFARESDATAIIVALWRDSKRQIQDTLRELRLADANVVGVILLKGAS